MVLFVLAQLIETAIEAQSIMAAYHITTLGAPPLCNFLFQKPLDTMRFYEFEVFYHAHMVFSAIAFIEVF
jgi:hypothetical protein